MGKKKQRNVMDELFRLELIGHLSIKPQILMLALESHKII